MHVKGIDASDIERVVRSVSLKLYDGNVIVRSSRNRHNRKGLRADFTIRVMESHGPGARRSRSGRHMPVACWHAHWHVIDRLLREYPDATIRTMLADYDRRTFHLAAGATAFINAGTAFEPIRLPEMCDCMDDEWRNPDPIGPVALPPLGAPPRPAPPERVAPLESRIAQEIAAAEATMSGWDRTGTAYTWRADTPHPYEEGLRTRGFAGTSTA